MRVAVTLEQLWHRVPGGTARATLDMVRALEADGRVDLIGVSAWHRAEPPGEWASPIPVRSLPMPRVLLYDAWQRLRHPIVERATGPVDLVHATAHVASASRAPWVATVHDLHFLHDPSHFTPRGVAVFNRFLGLVRDEAAGVLCPSQATRADCGAAGIDPQRLHLVPWATDAEPVGPGEVDRVRAAYGIDGPFVFFSGTVEPRKNLHRLIEAFGRVEPVVARLVVAGPEGWSTDLPTEGVHRIGFVPRRDLHALYAAATVVCYPSLCEGFGLPVLEAMVQGATVVTSGSTSTAEVAGDAAILVDPLDVDDIAAGLARAIADADLRERLGAAARVQAATFSWTRTAQDLVTAYEVALGGRR